MLYNSCFMYLREESFHIWETALINMHTNMPGTPAQEHERFVESVQKHSRCWKKLASPECRPLLYAWVIAAAKWQHLSLQSVCSERKQKVTSFYCLARCFIYRLFTGLPPPWTYSNSIECFGRECTDWCLAHTTQEELFLLSAKTTAWKYVLSRYISVWKCFRS